MPYEIDPLDEPLRDPEAAVVIGVDPKTLPSWRSQGRGPAYYKQGKLVWYTRRTIQEWRERGKCMPEKASVRRQRKALAAEAAQSTAM